MCMVCEYQCFLKRGDILYMPVYALQYCERIHKKLLSSGSSGVENWELQSALGDLSFTEYPILSLKFCSICT